MLINESILHLIITFLLGMAPISEVRGAIIYGTLHLPLWQAFVIGAVGNILSVAILLKFLDPVTKFLMKHSKWFNRILTRLFEKTRHKHSHRFNELGSIFLVSFVAIPLPVTGAWTGSLIAFLFGVKPKHAFPLLSIGIVCSATIVSTGVASVGALIEWIKNLV